MLFIEGDVRYLVGRNRYGWLVYDSYTGSETKNSYNGMTIVSTGFETEEDALEAARNLESEFTQALANKDRGYLGGYV